MAFLIRAEWRVGLYVFIISRELRGIVYVTMCTPVA